MHAVHAATAAPVGRTVASAERRGNRLSLQVVNRMMVGAITGLKRREGVQ